MALRYTAGFNSDQGRVYDIQIWDSAYDGAPEAVALSAGALEIEWKSTDKITPLQGSTATIHLYSDRDRQFVELYRVAVGEVRMDVLRDGQLYWSGTLDTEQYEEPYAPSQDYEVSVSFSDFGILKRLRYSAVSEFESVGAIVEHCVALSSISYTSVEMRISTKMFSWDESDVMDRLQVMAANWLDEEGEVMTAAEVLESVLQPLALRMVQKGGTVWVYDWNALAEDASVVALPQIAWAGKDATLRADVVYNNVEVSFSPYGTSDVMKVTVDPSTVVGSEVRTWLSWDASETAVGFTTRLSPSGVGVDLGPSAQFFAQKALYSGTDTAGVAWGFQTFAPSSVSAGYQQYGNAAVYESPEVLFTVPSRPYIHVGAGVHGGLRLSMELLFDPRYNPYEDAGDDNEGSSWEALQDWCNFVYVPLRLELLNDGGEVTHHYANHNVKTSTDANAPYALTGRWETGAAVGTVAWMCWWSGNRRNESGVGGWKKNKHMIGYWRDSLPGAITESGDGDLIALPPESGRLRVSVIAGVRCYDYGGDVPAVAEGIYDLTRWVMYRNFSLTVEDEYGNSSDAEDEVCSAWLNVQAAEGLTIETYVGTLERPHPTARGQLYDSLTGNVVSTLWRAGVSDRAERLLIGTAYSHYAERKNVLSGTVDLLPQMTLLTDANISGMYAVMSEVQRLRDDESEVTMSEVVADNYQADGQEVQP